MKKKIRIWILAVLAIIVAVNVFFYLYIKIAQYQAKSLFKEVQSNDRMYVYETFFGTLNPVFYVTDPADTVALIDYYKKVVNHQEGVINFKIKMMRVTLYEPMYVYKYMNRGSNIIELIDFDKSCWGYVKGYVVKTTVHRNRPADSLIKQEEQFISKQNKDKDVLLIKRIAKKISDYGLQCDD